MDEVFWSGEDHRCRQAPQAAGLGLSPTHRLEKLRAGHSLQQLLELSCIDRALCSWQSICLSACAEAVKRE